MQSRNSNNESTITTVFSTINTFFASSTFSPALEAQLKNGICSGKASFQTGAAIGGSLPYYVRYLNSETREEAIKHDAIKRHLNNNLLRLARDGQSIGFSNDSLALTLQETQNIYNQKQGLPDFPSELRNIIAQQGRDYKDLIPNYDLKSDLEEKEKAKTLTKDAKETPLVAINAARNGYIETLQYLLESKKIDVDSIIKTPFKMIQVNVLVGFGLSTYLNPSETTLLIESLDGKPNRGIALMLLEKYPMHINTLNYIKATVSSSRSYEGNALYFAKKMREAEVIKCLVAQGAESARTPEDLQLNESVVGLGGLFNS